MNYTFSIPFAKISLQDISASQLKFFKNIYFEQDFQTVEKISFEVIFQPKLKSSKNTLIAEKTSKSGNDFIISDTKGKRCSIDMVSLTNDHCTVFVEHGFDLYFAFTFIIEPLLIILSAANNIAYLHASSVSDSEGNALVFSAWRHTGKTHKVLNLLSEGYSFIGDDYTIFSDSLVYSYPKQINLFSYNFEQFPNLAGSFSLAIRIRLSMFQHLKSLLSSVSQILSGSLAKVFYRLSELAEIATNITLNPKQFFVTTSSAKLSALQILITGSSESKSERLDTIGAADKLFTIISYELLDFFSLYLGYQYLFGKKIPAIESFETNYKNALRSLPDTVTVEQSKPQGK